MPERRGRWPVAPVIYEIYPRSFRDTTGSGEGDLRGIVEGLDHIASLGVDGIWIAPFYCSPMDDGGYDISDHCEVDPRFGTMDDFHAIVKRAGELDLRVMTDQVLNHTSDQHPDFLAALDGDDEKAARYVFRDPKPDGSPPNNWISFFGSPAWTWAPRRRQYYLHQYLACQPSLDLRCEAVQSEMRYEIEFWRDRGVEGYRFDAVTAYLFDEGLQDNPPARPAVRERSAAAANNPYSLQDHEFDMLPGDGATFAHKLRQWAGPNLWLLGEIGTGNQSVEVARKFVCPEGLDAGYVIDVPESGGAFPVIADVLRRDDNARAIAWWGTSHDQPRLSPTPEHARMLTVLHAILPGPMMIYQGEELGLPQPKLDISEITDPFDRMYWPDAPGREGARVPLPWTERGDAFGFTTGTPWLPMRWSKGASVEAGGLGGMVGFCRDLFAFRKEHGFGTGETVEVSVSEHHLRLRLKTETGAWLALFNMGAGGLPCPEGAPAFASARPSGGHMPHCSGAIWQV